MARRWPPRRGTGRRSAAAAPGLLALASCAAYPALSALAGRGWLGPVKPAGAARDAEDTLLREGLAAAPTSGAGGGLSRREFWRETAAATAAGIWATSPSAAEAFRNDRILNAKKSYVPTIRAAYQKLEGLRDDLYLEVETEAGNADSRISIPARPADWFSGKDSSLDGPLFLISEEMGFGCKEIEAKVDGVVLMPRGRCTFADKLKVAKAAGAKALVVYDVKMSKQPLETQGKVGAVRSKGIATREAGDALYGGVAIVPVERGKTIMGVDGRDKPSLDAAMIGLTNGTALVDAINAGKNPKILDVRRFKFEDGIDQFIKKDLKKMLNEMEIFGNTMRVSKDDMGDPILKTLKTDRENFGKAVRSKDYGEIRRTFAKWNENLDNLGRWDLTELY